MERCFIRYILSIKNYLKKRSSYLTVFGMVCLLWLISGISIPDSANMRAGVCCGSSTVAHQITDILLAEEMEFEFVLYEEEESLVQDVISGKVDSGFVFSENFDEMFVNQDTMDGITYYGTPFSTKGDVLKEKIFSAYFKLHSETIFAEAEAEIFGNKDESRMQKLLEQYRFYLEGNEIFQIHIENVNYVEEAGQKTEVYSLAGLVALVVFLVMFLAYVETQVGEGDQVAYALTKREQFLYRFIKLLATATVPAIVGFIQLMFSETGKSFGTEGICLFSFVLLSALWINILGKHLGKPEDLSVWSLAIIFLHLLIYPIFYDFSVFIPAIQWIRYLFPLGIYEILR